MGLIAELRQITSANLTVRAVFSLLLRFYERMSVGAMAGTCRGPHPRTLPPLFRGRCSSD
jgi:hypothetical protein